jgi:hypothetical protein
MIRVEYRKSADPKFQHEGYRYMAKNKSSDHPQVDHELQFMSKDNQNFVIQEVFSADAINI